MFFPFFFTLFFVANAIGCNSAGFCHFALCLNDFCRKFSLFSYMFGLTIMKFPLYPSINRPSTINADKQHFHFFSFFALRLPRGFAFCFKQNANKNALSIDGKYSLRRSKKKFITKRYIIFKPHCLRYVIQTSKLF